MVPTVFNRVLLMLVMLVVAVQEKNILLTSLYDCKNIMDLYSCQSYN